MANSHKSKDISFEAVARALLDADTPFPPKMLHRFSDLEGKDLDALVQMWPHIPTRRRITLMQDLTELFEADTLMSFDAVAKIALYDSEAEVRCAAVTLLYESEDPKIARVFVDMVEKDTAVIVRTAAAIGLGYFVSAGVLESIPSLKLKAIEDVLIRVAHGSDELDIRRASIESLGFSARPEVPEIIETAFESGDYRLVSSALSAMGRSADHRWEKHVVQSLRASSDEILLGAVQAAGELGLGAARERLLDMIDEDDLDGEIRAAAVWSLSQIGGEGVRDLLETMRHEAEEDDEIEFLDEALDNLSFTEQSATFYGLIEIEPPVAPDELDTIIDVNENDEDEKDL